MESARIGLGVTMVSADAVAGDIVTGSLEEWRHPDLPMERPWHLLARAGEPLAPTPDRFLTHLLEPWLEAAGAKSAGSRTHSVVPGPTQPIWLSPRCSAAEYPRA